MSDAKQKALDLIIQAQVALDEHLGVSSVVGGSFSCPRCGGTGEEVVGVLAAHKICGRDGVDYMQGWDEGRALRAAGKSTSNSSTLEKQRR